MHNTLMSQADLANSVPQCTYYSLTPLPLPCFTSHTHQHILVFIGLWASAPTTLRGQLNLSTDVVEKLCQLISLLVATYMRAYRYALFCFI